MSLRETLHILKRVFGIARRIVRANRGKAYALRHQHAGVRNYAVDHRFDIGAMVADEDDDRALFARNVVQCVSPGTHLAYRCSTSRVPWRWGLLPYVHRV